MTSFYGGDGMTDIESRLCAMERQLRLQRRIVVLLLLCLVALGGYGATQGVPDVIRARKFEVIDTRGKVVGSIKTINNSGSLMLYNPKGKLVLSAQAHKNGQILLNNEDETPSIHAGNDGLFIFNDKGNTSIQAGNSGVFVYDRKGKPCLAATRQEGIGRLVLWDKAGDHRVLTPR